MAAANLSTASDIAVSVREIDFVTRFASQWEHLRDIMGIMRPVKKAAGTKLTSKYAVVELEDGSVGEGEDIPFSHAEVKEKEYATIALEKYAKAVSIEAIDSKDYENAVQRTDDEFLYELQNRVCDRFYSYLRTGTLKSTEADFQMALSMAQGRVRNKWKQMHKGITSVVGFCNVLDAYTYLGSAPISVQSQFGMDYIENFLGYSKLFLTSEIPSGTVIATPTDNIILYYIDPSDSGFSRAGLRYTTDGETNLIGFHAEGNYGNATTVSYAIMGMTLFAEYLDGIAVISFGGSSTDSADLRSLTIGSLELSPEFDPDVTSYTAATTAATNKITAEAAYTDTVIEIKNGSATVANGGSATWSAGENTVTVKVTNDSESKTYTVKVTKS